ncbi:MAG: ATPase, partial [Candidatus Hydrothermae bacterium]|nr:ATPase [Candidatus Hydrothermae bacterium]
IVTKRKIERTEPMGPPAPRIPLPESVRASRGKREVKIDVKAVDLIRFGYETIDLRHVEQLVDMSQTRAVAYSLYLASHRFMDGRRALSEILDLLERAFDEEGLDILDPFHRPGRHPGNFARPRRHEIAAALNRLRTLAVKRK